MSSFEKKSMNILLVMFAIYLVSFFFFDTNFLPFGHLYNTDETESWTNVLVRDVSSIPDSLKWKKTVINHIPGKPIALNDYGVSPSYLEKLVNKAKELNSDKDQIILKIFERNIGEKEFMIFRIKGAIKGDSLSVMATPIVLIKRDSTYIPQDFKP